MEGKNRTNDPSKFKGKCFYCKKFGHRISDGRVKKAQELKESEMANRASDDARGETLLTAMTMCHPCSEEKDKIENALSVKDQQQDHVKFNEHTWIGDTGASCHMMNNETGLYEIEWINDRVTLGSGKPMMVTKKGKLKVLIRQSDGSTTYATFNKVKYVPELQVILFGIL